MSASSPLIRLENVSKAFSEAGQSRLVLDAAHAEFFGGEFAVILGKSGSGKSTTLNVISGIDEPEGGDIWIDGTCVTRLPERERTLFRRDKMGIVFQFFNLIPTLTVLENIMLPYELRGTKGIGAPKGAAARKIGEKRGRDLLERVGLPDRAKTFPDRLSGGEQQRVAIARALIHEPLLVLADEPTGNLDGHTGESVLKLLLDLTNESGRTLIMVTHSMDVVQYADRVFRLLEGQLLDDTESAKQGALMRRRAEAEHLAAHSTAHPTR